MYLKLENISFRYPQSKNYILRDFFLEVKEGDIAAVMGSSGKGKTTVLRLIAGLQTPERGVISIANTIVFSKGFFIPPEKRQVGMIFQDLALFPHLSVEKNISFGLQKKSSKEKKEIIRQMLELTEMEKYSKVYPHELSGGQQQRIAIARALAPHPRVLLLDEPFSGLDQQLKEKIRKQIRTILKQASITSVFVTHDIEDAESMADQLIEL